MRARLRIINHPHLGHADRIAIGPPLGQVMPAGRSRPAGRRGPSDAGGDRKLQPGALTILSAVRLSRPEGCEMTISASTSSRSTDVSGPSLSDVTPGYALAFEKFSQPSSPGDAAQEGARLKVDRLRGGSVLAAGVALQPWQAIPARKPSGSHRTGIRHKARNDLCHFHLPSSERRRKGATCSRLPVNADEQQGDMLC